MAGATAEVLLRQSISDGERELIENYIRTAASSVEGKSFWIAGQPFVWYDGTADEEELALDIFGLNPHGMVGFCAMCRGPVSEAYLAMLVARIAQKLDGVIALGGHIKSFADDGILVTEGRFEGAYGDYVTPEFLYHWIGHAKFRMMN